MKDLFLVKRFIYTEKAGNLNQIGKYVFMVKLNATKNEIKKAVKELYKVDVVDVNTIRVPGKTKRFRNMKTQKSDFKKAIVTLKEGQKIEERK